MLTLLAESAAIGPQSTLTIGLAIIGGSGLIGLGSWSALLRHTQDKNTRTIADLKKRLKVLEEEKTAREAVEDYKRDRLKRRSRTSDDTMRPRPDESSV
jgi:hypothetical protein